MPPPAVSYNDLAKQYGLAATLESVVRLTQLVSKQDADMDEIGKLISKDIGLTASLLRAANPRAESPADYTIDTVEDALMRTGLGCVLILAMSQPLSSALVKAFDMMLSLKLERLSPRAALPLAGTNILGTIGFDGKASGCVFVRMSPASAKTIVSNILGMDSAELDDATVSDTIGELVNIMTGNFKSNLCDAGLDCRITPPSVRHTEEIETPTVDGGGLERMAFRTGPITLFVDLAVNPWND